jgi:hypothetical protein
MLPTKFRFIWTSGFRGEDFFKSANQKQELPVAAMLVNGSGQNLQSLERTFYRCFLPSFSSFGWGVSEEKFKMWKVKGRQTTDAKWWQKLTLPLARIKHQYKSRYKIITNSWIFINHYFFRIPFSLQWDALGHYICQHVTLELKYITLHSLYIYCTHMYFCCTIWLIFV